jgi:hypothetical protein
MSNLRLHQRLVRNGWCIPKLMEWMFWPTGYQPVAKGFEESVQASGTKLEPSDFIALGSAIIQESLRRRFSMTNQPEFMAVLRKLGAVR